MISRILVPLDGSDASETALAPALELASKFDARVVLLTVMIRYPESRIHVPTLDARSVENGQAYLAEVRSRHSVPESAVAECLLGDPAQVILESAGTEQADVIVMSTHGTTGSDAFKHSLGSVAWKVLQNAPCPVFLVPIPR